MDKLIVTFAVCLCCAYLSQRNGAYRVCGEKQPWNGYMIALIVCYALMVGLRTNYNDTSAYKNNFRNMEPIGVFLQDKENLDLLQNPLFYMITSLFRTVTDNYHLYFLAFALFDAVLLIRFVQRYAPEKYFTFAIFLFFTMGTAVFSVAAMKQITAMAVLTAAIPYLLDRKWIPYFLIVFIAGTLHTYAFMFLFLPLFLGKPWHGWTLVLVGGTVAVMLTFESSIQTFLQYADSHGKHVAEEEVLDENTMNLFRVAVYAVTPLLSLIYWRKLEYQMRREQYLLINMSVFSLMFMLLATMAGANMFGRMATYFELGAVCVLPWLVDKIWSGKTRWLVYRVAIACFLFFFFYDNQGFGADYQAVSLWSLL